MKRIYLTETEKGNICVDNISEVLNDALDSAAMESGAMGTEVVETEIHNLPVEIELPVELPTWKKLWWEWCEDEKGKYLFVSASEE